MTSSRDDLVWRKFTVLDQGHVALVDSMGDDAAICAAARVSYGKGTKSVSDDRDLIRYLFRHKHTSPFEMAEIKLHVRVPMDCWRQWIRHRTANVNEYSTRYSEAIDAMQATPPDGWRLQVKDNKQGSSGFLGTTTRYNAYDPDSETGDSTTVGGDYLSKCEADFHFRAREIYQDRLDAGVAREQARKDLPLSTLTEAYWKCDLRNVFHFLALRMDGHAQLEIRSYANVIGHEIVKPLFPLAWEAFVDYQLNSLILNGPDLEAIRLVHEGAIGHAALGHITNKREREECRAKLIRLGIIKEYTAP